MKRGCTLFFIFLCGFVTICYSGEYKWVDISSNLPDTPGVASLSDMYWVNDQEGWICSGARGEIYHTSDGGETFTIQTTQYYTNAIHMLNSGEGYAGGYNGRVYRTTDSGATWNVLGSIGGTLLSISFPPSSDTGYCCGYGGRIYRITATGVSSMSSGVYSNLASVTFSGIDGFSCGESMIIHYNGSWLEDQSYPTESYNAIYMLNKTTGWAVGDNGVIIKTTDGTNWNYQTNPDASKRTLLDIFFLNVNEGWAVGNSGIILHTTNGGTTWLLEGSGLTTNMLRSVQFTSSTNGYVIGNNGTLLHYTETTTPVVGVPTLSSPANSATDQPLNLSLTWNAVSEASSYRVQLSTSSSFATTIVDDSTLTTPTYAVSSLSNGTMYYWRVRAKNAGGVSSWSETWSFITVPPAAGVPTLSSPANNATDQPLNLSLTWNAVSGASNYHVQLSTNSTFATGSVDDSTLTTPTRAVGPLSNSTTYYWHVRAKNAVGVSSWSETRSFITVPPAAGVPTLSSPTHNATDQPLNLSLTWNAVSGASNYHVQLSTNSTFATGSVDDSTLTTPTRAVGPLSNSTTYYWHVRAKNAVGVSSWSETRSFITVPPAAGVPTLSSPANNATDQPLNLSLTWNAVSGASNYHVQLSTSSTFATVSVDDSTLTTPTHAVGPLSNHTTYYWRVRAKNASGVSTWSSEWSFTTIPTVPQQITQQNPLPGTVISVDSTVLSWSRPSGLLDRFGLEVYSDSLTTNVLLIDTSLSDTFTVYRNLQSGTSLWWRVRAHNSAGWSAYSTLSKLIVDIPTRVILPANYSVVAKGISTTGDCIRYGLPQLSDVTVVLYDLNGRIFFRKRIAHQHPGYYTISIPGHSIAKGIYVLSFVAGDYKSVSRLYRH